jgi:hypothetical protein
MAVRWRPNNARPYLSANVCGRPSSRHPEIGYILATSGRDFQDSLDVRRKRMPPQLWMGA